jgi:hypothetical protein
MTKITLPEFLKNTEISEDKYLKWLKRKAVNIANRDRGRKRNVEKKYRELIHNAVEKSKGKDFYTGEVLDWNLISTYNNEEAKQGGLYYMKKFSKLPTIDHEYGSKMEFKVCSWLTNDCKSYLNHNELTEFCRKIIAHSESI